MCWRGQHKSWRQMWGRSIRQTSAASLPRLTPNVTDIMDCLTLDTSLQLHLKDDVRFATLAATYAVLHTMPTRARNVKSTFLLQFQHPYFMYKAQSANLQFVSRSHTLSQCFLIHSPHLDILAISKVYGRISYGTQQASKQALLLSYLCVVPVNVRE